MSKSSDAISKYRNGIDRALMEFMKTKKYTLTREQLDMLDRALEAINDEAKRKNAVEKIVDDAKKLSPEAISEIHDRLGSIVKTLKLDQTLRESIDVRDAIKWCSEVGESAVNHALYSAAGAIAGIGSAKIIRPAIESILEIGITPDTVSALAPKAMVVAMVIYGIWKGIDWIVRETSGKKITESALVAGLGLVAGVTGWLWAKWSKGVDRSIGERMINELVKPVLKELSDCMRRNRLEQRPYPYPYTERGDYAWSVGEWKRILFRITYWTFPEEDYDGETVRSSGIKPQIFRNMFRSKKDRIVKIDPNGIVLHIRIEGPEGTEYKSKSSFGPDYKGQMDEMLKHIADYMDANADELRSSYPDQWEEPPLLENDLAADSLLEHEVILFRDGEDDGKLLKAFKGSEAGLAHEYAKDFSKTAKNSSVFVNTYMRTYQAAYAKERSLESYAEYRDGKLIDKQTREHEFDANGTMIRENVKRSSRAGRSRKARQKR